MNGFSLLEMLITLSIIGILAAISLPMYEHETIQTRRGDGQIALLNLALRLETYYETHQSFEGATLGTGGPGDVLPSVRSKAGWYTLAITDASKDRYKIEARPRGLQGQADGLCQTLTLNEANQAGIAPGPKGNPMGPAERCWA